MRYLLKWAEWRNYIAACGVAVGFFFRRSISAGPVRFNFSKSGVGVSFGTRGLRYGVRPDGQAYVSAGRYGFYYRQNLGSKGRPRRQSPESNSAQSPFAPGYVPRPSASASASCASAVASTPRASDKDLLVNLFHQASSAHHFHALAVYATALPMACLTAVTSPLLGIVACSAAGWLMWFVGRWESRRREICLYYNPACAAYSNFAHVVNAFNALASCDRVHLVTDRSQLLTLHESKRNAGAASLFDSVPALLGEGSLPPVETNVPIPVLRARSQAVYFLPDRLLVFDRTGIGELCFSGLTVDSHRASIIESTVPADSKVIGSTWLHPNLDGGPDCRFSVNYQIPICEFSAISIRSPGGLVLNLLASNLAAGSFFSKRLSEACCTAKSSTESAEASGTEGDPYLAVAPEHFQSFSAAVWKALIQGRREFSLRVASTLRRANSWLAKIAGAGNTIVYRFLQYLAMTASCIVAAFLVYVMSLLLTW